MSTIPNTVAAQDVKRRGVAALQERLLEGPVYVIKHNRPVCVVLSEEAYRDLVDEAATARLAASRADLREGRVRATSALLDE